MILTQFLSPVFVKSFDYKDEYFDITEMARAPFFCTHIDKEKPLKIPTDWQGCLYASEKVLAEIRAENDWCTNVYLLGNNKEISVLLSNSNSIKVTMFPVGIVSDDCCMLFLEDAYISCLFTSRLGNFLDEIFHNSLLREKIRHGIDVLYIDDSIYGNQLSADSDHPNEFQLRALVHFVRPKEVIGNNGNELPQYIKELCDGIGIF